MKCFNKFVASTLALVLALVLGGFPEVAAAQQPTNVPDAQNVPTAPGTTRVDPSQGPIEPAPEALPEGPTPQNQPPQAVPPAPAPAAQPAAQNQQQNQTEPLGTAAAEKGRTVGGAASRPAGAAIAPAKQRQMRSLLIKVGAILGAGAAIGIVYGLSRSTPSTPPGSTTAGATQH